MAGSSKRTESSKRNFSVPPPYAHNPPITAAQLEEERDAFWTTLGSGAYGGSLEIWAALKLAVSSDIKTARAVVESAGIIVPGNTLAICYDERGQCYELPPFVLSKPNNLIR